MSQDQTNAQNDAWRNENYKINAYICPKQHIVTTVDIGDVKAPDEFPCLICAKPTMAKSINYPKFRPVPPIIPAPMIEFQMKDEKLEYRQIQTPMEEWARHE